MAAAKKPKVRDKAIIDAIRKKFGVQAALSVTEERAAAGQITEYISTGVDVLDHYVIGRGGLPCGRISEIYGTEGCGKTSLAYSAIAAAQAEGGIAVVADSEYSFDEERARTFGVDLGGLIVLQPQNMEEFFEQVKTILEAHDPDDGKLLIVWDSLASTKTKIGETAVAGESKIGEVPRLLSQELPKLLKPLHRKRAHLMILNQIRAKIGVMFGPNTTTPGGNAPKFYASVRVEFFGGKAVKNAAGEHIAKVVTILAQKNRLAPPFRKARVRFDYATGYNNLYSTVEHAKTMKVIEPRERGFSGKGKEGVAAYTEACSRLGWKPRIPDVIPGEHGSGDEDATGDEVNTSDDDD